MTLFQKKYSFIAKRYKKKPLVAFMFLSLSPMVMAESLKDNDTIIVTASKSHNNFVNLESRSATKSNEPLILTPQSVSVINQDQIQTQGATSVTDALNYSSGVFTNYRGSSNRNDEVIIRGFRYGAKFLDGLSYGMGSNGTTGGQVDPWFLEFVELVHGPASVLYGQVSPGGIINMMSKRPSSQATQNMQMRGGNKHLGEVAFDVGNSLTADNSLMFRVNGLARKQNQFVRDYKQERVAIAPSLTWLPNNETEFTLLTFFQDDPKAGFRNFLPIIGTAKPSANAGYIPHDMNVSEPSFNQSRRKQSSIGYQLQHTFNDILSFEQNLRYGNIKERYKYLVYTWNNLDISDTSLSRRAQKEHNKTDELGIDNQLKAQFSTGIIEHTLLTGLDYKWDKQENKLWRAGGYDFDWAKPVWGIYIDESLLRLSTDNNKKLNQLGVYLQDQLSLANWNLLLSGRYDNSKVTIKDHMVATKDRHNDDKFTGRAGLLYAFDNGISPYISYSTSFEPNLDTGAPGTADFKPTTGEQTEIGIKFQPTNSQTMLTFSLFDITQKNITSYNHVIGYNEQIGKVRSKGFEAELNSQLTPEIHIISSYSYTDLVTKESNNKLQIDQPMAAQPKHTAAFFGLYNFQRSALKGFTLGGGVRYIGTSYADNVGNTKIPLYKLYDVISSYELGESLPALKGASIQFNVHNLTNKKYVASCSGDSACFYGSGRSMFATINYRW